MTLSLKKTGVPPGDATTDQMDAVADWPTATASARSASARAEPGASPMCDARATCTRCGLERKALGFATPNIGLLTNIISCPGGDFCSLANAEVDPGRGGDPAPLRRPRLPVRHRRAGPEHLGLHEFVRPSPRRPHRHPRCRQERGGVVPGLDRRRGQGASRLPPSAASSGRRSRRDEVPDVVERLIADVSRATRVRATSVSSTSCTASASSRSSATCMKATLIKQRRDAWPMPDAFTCAMAACSSRTPQPASADGDGVDRFPTGAIVAAGHLAAGTPTPAAFTGVWLDAFGGLPRLLVSAGPAPELVAVTFPPASPTVAATRSRACCARGTASAESCAPSATCRCDHAVLLRALGFDAFALPPGTTRDAAAPFAPRSRTSARCTRPRRTSRVPAVQAAPAGGGRAMSAHGRSEALIPERAARRVAQ